MYTLLQFIYARIAILRLIIKHGEVLIILNLIHCLPLLSEMLHPLQEVRHVLFLVVEVMLNVQYNRQ